MVDDRCMSQVGRGGRTKKSRRFNGLWFFQICVTSANRALTQRLFRLILWKKIVHYATIHNVKLQVWMSSRDKSCGKQQCVQVEMLVTLPNIMHVIISQEMSNNLYGRRPLHDWSWERRSKTKKGRTFHGLWFFKICVTSDNRAFTQRFFRLILCKKIVHNATIHNVKLQVWMSSTNKSCGKQQCAQVEML